MPPRQMFVNCFWKKKMFPEEAALASNGNVVKQSKWWSVFANKNYIKNRNVDSVQYLPYFYLHSTSLQTTKTVVHAYKGGQFVKGV